MTKKQASDILNVMRGENIGYDKADRFEALTMAMDMLEGKAFTHEKAVKMIEETEADIIKGIEGSTTADLIHGAFGLLKCKIGIDYGEADEKTNRRET